jgi:LysM repeat protein
MKHLSRFVFIAAVLVLAAIFVLPVSAGRLPSAAVFQSPPDTPTLPPPDTPTLPPPDTETPTLPPPATATSTVLPATNTPVATATNTPSATATNAPIATATNTPMPPQPTATPYPMCTPPICLAPGHLACGNPNGCPNGCGTICVMPPPPPPPPVYPIIGYWTVQPGQTLYCIGRYYQVSPWAIATVNYIPWPYFIYPGQVLSIPNAPWYNIPPGPVCYPGVPNVTPTPLPGVTVTPGPTMTPYPTPTPMPTTCRYYHYVQWGQTLSGIAWYYGTTIQAIMYVNPFITNPNLIYAGSTLCIP